MRLLVVSGIDLSRAVREVRVLAVLDRPAAGKVFGGAGHAARSERRALHAGDVGNPELGDQFGVLTEGLRLTCPAWFRRQVQRGVEGCSDADSRILLAGDVGESMHQFRLPQCREPEHLRPLGETPGGETRSRVLCEGMAGVAGDGHRDAVRRLLGQRLDGVLPSCRRSSIAEEVHVEVIDELVPDDRGGCRLADGTRTLHHRPVGPRLDDGMEHEPDLLRKREPAEEVLDSLGDGKMRILVGIHDPVAVQIAVRDPLWVGGEGCSCHVNTPGA